MQHPELRATPRQMRYLLAVAREAGLDEAALEAEIRKRFDIDFDALSRRQASNLIEDLGSRRLDWGNQT